MNFEQMPCCFCASATLRRQRQTRGRGRQEGTSSHVKSPSLLLFLPWLAGDGGAVVSALSILVPGRASPIESLSDAAVRQYHELGYYAPVPVLTRTGQVRCAVSWRRSRLLADQCKARCATSRICCSRG